MADGMAAQGVPHVAMESTGVFWKPIFNILESHYTVLLVNAWHLKQVPGRKSDIRDCQWIAQLLQHGLLKASFIPPRPQRELRDLTRHRRQLVEEKGRSARQEAHPGRRGPFDAGDLLPYAQPGHDLHGLGRRPLRPPEARTPAPVLRQTP